SGSWYRFSVTQDGVYELTYAFLESMGVDVSDLQSDAINIYGNHAGLLPFTNLPFLPTDLLQNAVLMEDGGDGHFDPGDRILFYASGPQRWVQNGTLFNHVKNVYTDSASYFVGIGVDPPKRITNTVLSTQPVTDEITTFNDRQVIDKDAVNLIKSGRTMFSETYDQVLTYNYNFSVPYLHSADPVSLQVNVLARSIGGPSSFTVLAGGATNTIAIPTTSVSETGDYGKYVSAQFSLQATGSNLPISVTYVKSDPVLSVGYMDFLELNDRRDLTFFGDQLTFRDLQSVGTGHVGQFTLDQAGAAEHIWEVTHPEDAREVPVTVNGVAKSFILNTDSLREFIAFKGTGLLQPIAEGAVPNQDLHATPTPTDLVIVCPAPFMSEAQRLADHRADEGLSVVLVTPQQVFNEFSSGQRDATAIKRYMKMLYDRAGSDPALVPRYLLLFGDGSYNNLSLSPSNQNWVPTYETYNSWNFSNSYTSDDYFITLDDADGESAADLVDMGVGRLPVSSTGQAHDAVNKLLNYDKYTLSSTATTSCTSGSDGGANDWRNSVLFCADDRGEGGGGSQYDGTAFMGNSDALAQKTAVQDPCLNINKIYLDAYVQFTTPGGQRYPDAENDLRDRVQRGSLVVNYVGHGGEVGWAHERFLDNTTILGWTNLDRLPLFMTATCEFSRWDDPGRTSAGENVFLNPNGGGIGLMTTTRLAYAGPNQNLSMDFYNVVFQPTDELGRDQRFGDIYRRTKVAATTTSGVNHRNFTLLGDPSARLALARNKAMITAITDTLGNPLDTIQALSVVRISGTVNAPTGEVLTDFNGTVVPTVFDKQSLVNTLDNDPPPPPSVGQPYSFKVRKNILYRGRATVTDGHFQFTFVVPKDIDYQVDSGRVSVYAESLTANACGYTNDPLVGGTDNSAAADAIGPTIELYLNDDQFVPGGITNETPLLYAKLYDQSGINTAGSSIGHDLVAVVDANTENAVVLNDWYEADKDTYKSGQVRYKFSTIAEGNHTLDLKAWDVYNNSTEKSTDFVVAPSAQLALAHVLNYPNPFTTHTEFYFEHNRPCTVLDCQVQIFTVSGRLVKTLNRRLDCDGFRSEPLAWDGLDDHGDRIGRGVYVYRLSITTPTGEKADKIEKLVILR
ncbi:MAG: type IX secretion system sortase PorU, partial [Flavobacteriales bacterium]